MAEVWVDIKGFENLYQVSNYGRVKRLSKVIHNNGLLSEQKNYMAKELILKPSNISKGYQGVTLIKDGIRYPKKVHRLVAQAFIPNPLGKRQVNHIDCNKKNNCVDNLEWTTQYENMAHAKEHGLLNFDKARKSNCRNVSQYDLDGNFIKEWHSLKEAGNYLGVPSGNISHCCRGKIKQAYGYIWKYTKGE